MPPVILTVKFRFKPYIVKFLLANSKNKRQPIQFHRKHRYNISLIRKVTNYNRKTHFALDDRQAVSDHLSPCNYQEITKIVLPFSKRKNILYYNYLSQQARREFTEEITDEFNHELLRFLITNLNKGIQRKKICEMFKQKYGITEDELQTDTLYRHTTRLLGKYKNNKNL